MSGGTLFERRMEKALAENTEAMFKVPLGDSHLHAKIKGVREGLEKALGFFRQDFQSDETEDGI
jgi:hypothetical protein